MPKTKQEREREREMDTVDERQQQHERKDGGGRSTRRRSFQWEFFTMFTLKLIASRDFIPKEGTSA